MGFQVCFARVSLRFVEGRYVARLKASLDALEYKEQLPLGLEVAALQGLISDNYVALAEFGGIELFLRRSRKEPEFLNRAEKFFLEVDSERDLLLLSFEYRLLLLDESSLIRLASASRRGAGEEVEDRLLEGFVRVRQAARRDA